MGGIPNASVPYIAYSAGGWTTLTPQYIDSASTNNVSLGTYAGRVAYEFSMPGGYQGPWWGPEESRSEFLYGPPATSNDSPLGPGFYGPGQTVTFAYSFYVPQGFPTDMAWATLFQTHPSGPTWQGNQLSVNVNGGTLAFGDFNSSQHKIALSDLMGQWVNVTAKAYFSQGDDGQIQWTVQIGSQSPMSWTTNGATIGPDSVGTYIKQGLYRQYDYGGYASVYETPVMLYAG